MEDFPTLGRILVVREDYTFCACDDGYIWTITFDEVWAHQCCPGAHRLIATSGSKALCSYFVLALNVFYGKLRTVPSEDSIPSSTPNVKRVQRLGQTVGGS